MFCHTLVISQIVGICLWQLDSANWVVDRSRKKRMWDSGDECKYWATAYIYFWSDTQGPGKPLRMMAHFAIGIWLDSEWTYECKYWDYWIYLFVWLFTWVNSTERCMKMGRPATWFWTGIGLNGTVKVSTTYVFTSLIWGMVFEKCRPAIEFWFAEMGGTIDVTMYLDHCVSLFLWIQHAYLGRSYIRWTSKRCWSPKLGSTYCTSSYFFFSFVSPEA